MNTIKFTNGKTIEYLKSTETSIFYNGSERRILEIELPLSALTLNDINDLLTEDKTLKLEMHNPEVDVRNIYSGYVIKKQILQKAVEITTQTDTTPAVIEEHIFFELCTRTYIETVLKNMGI